MPRASTAVGNPGAASAPAEATATPAGRKAAVRAGPSFSRVSRLAMTWTASVMIEVTA